MKIDCHVYIVNRVQHQLKTRSIKSTLAIGSHPPNSEKSEFFILHFTATNKTGARYRIKNNIERVFARCIDSGKMTLSLKDPQLDLQINGDAVLMKSFLRCLKLAMEGKNVDANGKRLIASVASTTKYEPPKTKMVVVSRKDYPLKGFPKSLVNLTISGVRLKTIDPQIFNLFNLTHLSLCDNQIEQIPNKLGNLPLQIFTISNNDLSNTSWKWLQGKTITSTLHYLDLSQTKLKRFPTELIDVKNLTKLELVDNQIQLLPFSIRAMKSLRNLNLSGNQLKSVPENLNLVRLQHLDVSNNPLSNAEEAVDDFVLDFKRAPSSLLEIAGRVVIRNSIQYSPSTLPKILRDYLEKMPICNCGNICFSSPVMRNAGDFIWRYNNTVMVKDTLDKLRKDAVFCSKRCFKKK